MMTQEARKEHLVVAALTLQREIKGKEELLDAVKSQLSGLMASGETASQEGVGSVNASDRRTVKFSDEAAVCNRLEAIGRPDLVLRKPREPMSIAALEDAEIEAVTEITTQRVLRVKLEGGG